MTKITRKPFGSLADGTDVELFTLDNQTMKVLAMIRLVNTRPTAAFLAH